MKYATNRRGVPYDDDETALRQLMWEERNKPRGAPGKCFRCGKLHCWEHKPNRFYRRPRK